MLPMNEVREVGRVIYIMLSNTGTLLSKAIGMYTRKELNHTSIAFDEELKEVYSFGRKNKHNPFIGGFVQENVSKGLFKDATCAIYKCNVTLQEYNRMRDKISRIEQQKEMYKYNLIGLFGVAMKIRLERERAFFCSQFVATIINECENSRLDIPPYFVQPYHFAQHPSLQLIYCGDLQEYLYSRKRDEVEQERAWKQFGFQMQA